VFINDRYKHQNGNPYPTPKKPEKIIGTAVQSSAIITTRQPAAVVPIQCTYKHQHVSHGRSTSGSNEHSHWNTWSTQILKPD
jgi:hypothetical protein